MKAFEKLPDGYREIYTVNLQKDKKMALLINLAAAVIDVLLVVPMLFVVPIHTLVDFNADVSELSGMLVKLVSVCVLSILYLVLHEAVHGIVMKICGTKKVKFGFTGLYAFAGSEDYYDKKSYIFIALAPVVLWGVVLAVVNALVPVEWFWVIYLVQTMNISGAVGDLFVTWKFSRMPRDILVHDTGVGMTVYSECEWNK